MKQVKTIIRMVSSVVLTGIGSRVLENTEKAPCIYRVTTKQRKRRL